MSGDKGAGLFQQLLGLLNTIQRLEESRKGWRYEPIEGPNGPYTHSYRKSTSGYEIQLSIEGEGSRDIYPDRVGHATTFILWYGPADSHKLERRDFDEQYMAEAHEPGTEPFTVVNRPLTSEELGNLKQTILRHLNDFPEIRLVPVITTDLEDLYEKALRKLPQDWANYRSGKIES